MNVRAFLVIPAAVAVAVLAGCGQTDGGSGSEGSGSGAGQLDSVAVDRCVPWTRIHPRKGARRRVRLH